MSSIEIKMSSLSILASHDELVRCTNVLVNGSCEEEFLQFALNQEETRQKWLSAVVECQRLHCALEKSRHESTDLERKLSHARRLLDEEKRRRRAAEEQRNSLERQIAMVRDLLFNDGGRNLNDETREKLQFLNNTTLTNGRHSGTTNSKDYHNDKLNTIAELDSTGSILSDLSCYSKSEDDLDASMLLNQNYNKRDWKEHRPSGEYLNGRKRKSTVNKVVDLNNSDRIIATTTVVVPKEGAVTASSVIEAITGDENRDPNELQRSRKRRKSVDRKSKKDFYDADDDTKPSAPLADNFTSGSDNENVFKPSPNIGGYTFNTKSMRAHSFAGKTVIKSEVCSPCGNRIKFGKLALK
ncbi:Similar to Racgap1: Rac GTPase-activating protein 1 (Mus musculus) [Cotesia congregata]|uniref:Similar to Racgap1: Rac GTPase-activating protein 1 (Mus musculus) n=1 Tax=Cotesia congregata TaxID=51543 RepID=A0A8J2EAZ9_COTCN|nr:Similar to Racgap1: Rac GTPase-activating protein 1 (Mus musculus) [Cotesia congregata]